MKVRSYFNIRRLLSLLGLLAVMAALLLFPLILRREEQIFADFTQQLFLSEMTSNTLNMHYTLAYPADFGIREYETILPCYSSNNHLTAQLQTENLIAGLRCLNPDKLPKQDVFTRKLLLESLENSLILGSLPYYEEPLSPSSGMQSQLPILLAEYTFRNKRDIEDYLKILDQTDEYLEALLIFEQEKAAAHLLMPSVSLQKVIQQCDTILTKKELDCQTHFLQVTFQERLVPLLESGLLTTQEVNAYLSENDRLLRTVMLPAYQALGDGLMILKDSSISLEGLAAKPAGTLYYEKLLFSQTGSSRSIPEIKALLTDRFQREAEAIRQLIIKTPSLADTSLQAVLEQDFPYRKADEMLVDLQARMQQDFPKLEADNDLLHAAIKTVSSSLENYCAPAYYLTPPLDDTSSNAIYINEKSTPAGLELYTTLAHEGYPGHMYQTVYHNQHIMSLGPHSNMNVRELLWYGGYLEGWALYVEFIAYDYASRLYQEQETNVSLYNITNTALAEAVQLAKHDRSLLLCLYSILDIMIHYENASVDRVSELLSPLGITDQTAVHSIYEYIVEEPTNYLKYYLGYLEILELKKTAKTLWGEAYSDYNFHTFYLNCGPASFPILEEALKSYPLPKKD